MNFTCHGNNGDLCRLHDVRKGSNVIPLRIRKGITLWQWVSMMSKCFNPGKGCSREKDLARLLH